MISINIEPESGMAIATCSGVLGITQAKEAASALWKMPGWLGRSAVWDFRQAKFDLSTADIREVALFILSNQPDSPPKRIAWVTARDVDFGLSRMFEVFREDAQTKFRVFRDYQKAVTWARTRDPAPLQQGDQTV